jgi:hypothetical protein
LLFLRGYGEALHPREEPYCVKGKKKSGVGKETVEGMRASAINLGI